MLPHLPNTGSFFVALHEKVLALQLESKREKVLEKTKKKVVYKKGEPPKRKFSWVLKRILIVFVPNLHPLKRLPLNSSE